MARHATNVLSSACPSSKSWFWRLRQLCLQYGLPHPADWLSSRPTKWQVKKRVKAAVLQFWLGKLRSEAGTLSSLRYLKTGFLGLTKPHPMFTSCGASPWEVEKSIVQSRLLSGRYRIEGLTSHWVPWNRAGMCSLPECWDTPQCHKGTVESFLLSCPSLSLMRRDLTDLTITHLQTAPDLTSLVLTCLQDDPVQFWLDCSVMAQVITVVQQVGEGVLDMLFRWTRNYCFGLHRARMALLESE